MKLESYISAALCVGEGSVVGAGPINNIDR